MVDESGDIITLEKAEKLLPYKRGNLYRMAKEGVFPAFKFPGGKKWFVRRSALNEWLKGQEVQSKTAAPSSRNLLEDMKEGRYIQNLLSTAEKGHLWIADFLRNIKEPVDKIVAPAWENGIEAIYPPRKNGGEANTAMEAMLKDTRGELLLQGISLGQFFHSKDFRPTIWKKITSGDNFKIKALILYPFGNAALSRVAAEESTEGEEGEEFEAKKKFLHTQLFKDIQFTVSNIIDTNRKCPPEKLIEAKFYDCTPFSFFLMTDEGMIIEQYHFGRQDYASKGECIGQLVPLIRANSKSAYYSAMRSSFYHLWNAGKNNPFIKTKSLDKVNEEIEEFRSKEVWPEK